MLHWLAGQKQPEGNNDPDATGYVEPPETPAPVFAVRAFKHAIFGTPQTAQPKPRRHSNTENGRPRNTESKPTRPGMNRPKSSGDAQMLFNQELFDPVEEPLSSPTKGILLSPGTAAARKKNVTFGENVKDNEAKRPLKSGLPDDCPGKFPSPWNADSREGKNYDASAEGGKGRTKLVDAFEQAREDTKRRKAKTAKRKKDDESDNELPADIADPQSASGKYWKREYDIYRTNTQREVKKLIAKQMAAKSFAHMKDTQCTELADQLRQEQKKVETLEAKTIELAALIKDLQDELRAGQFTDRARELEASRMKRQITDKDLPSIERPKEQHLDQGNALKQDKPSNRSTLPGRSSEGSRRRENDAVQRPSEPLHYSALFERRIVPSDAGKTEAAPNSTQGNPPITGSDDIWAQSFNSQSSAVSRPAKPELSLPRGHKADSVLETNPLQTLDLNKMQRLPGDSKSVESKPVRREDQRKDDLLLLPSDLPPVSPEERPEVDPFRLGAPDKTNKRRRDHRETAAMSSSFDVDPPVPPPHATSATSEANSLLPVNTKENIAPDVSGNISQASTATKPSAVWHSINSSQNGRRNNSMTAKDGREVSIDRIEAARARIAARGRVT